MAVIAAIRGRVVFICIYEEENKATMQNHPVVILCADADNVGGHLCGIRRRSGGTVGTA